MKKLLILLLLLVLVVALVGHFGAGALLKAGVEKGGSHALDTDVHVGGASVSLLGGSLGLDHVHVHNPEGFQGHDAFSVDEIAVAADVGSLLGDTVEVKEIEIVSPVVTVELTQQGTNIGKLLANIQAKGSGEPKEGSGKKLHVGRLVIAEPKVKVAKTVLIKNEAELALPTIELNDVGGGQPLTLSQLIELILAAIMARTQGVSGLPADLKGTLQKEANKALDDVKKQIDEQLGDIQKDLEKGIKKGLDDLLGNKKKG